MQCILIAWITEISNLIDGSFSRICRNCALLSETVIDHHTNGITSPYSNNDVLERL